MKLTTLSDDEGLGIYFQRLVDSNPKEICIFQPDTLPEMRETDIYIYFPCNDKTHVDCGFFVWVLSIQTVEALHEDMENVRQELNLSDKQIANATKTQEMWSFGILVKQPRFNKFDILKLTSDWVTTWVEELKDVTLTLVDLFEHRRIWARYEEYHPEPEAVDIFFNALRGKDDMGTLNGKSISVEEFMDMLRHAVLESLQENKGDDEDGCI